MASFYSNGKLLLTGEYLVLDGAKALAVPTKFGQHMTVNSIEAAKIVWKSINYKGEIWFEDEFPIEKKILAPLMTANEISKRIIQILNAVKALNPDVLTTNSGFNITNTLDFPENWGLGSSSTLINNMAVWSQVDPYQLLDKTFGGSGYDIACAQHNEPILYTVNNNMNLAETVAFDPSFKDQIFFVHLNKKQNSRDGIKRYNRNKVNLQHAITEINDVTRLIIKCNRLSDFKNLVQVHEEIISKLIKTTPIKAQLFSDYHGAIKSLGAWGGDFIMATGNLSDMNYFKTKGYHTILSYEDMVLAKKSASQK